MYLNTTNMLANGSLVICLIYIYMYYIIYPSHLGHLNYFLIFIIINKGCL